MRLFNYLLAGIVGLSFMSCQSSGTEEKYVFKDTTGLNPSKPVQAPVVTAPQQPQMSIGGANSTQPGATPVTFTSDQMQKAMQQAQQATVQPVQTNSQPVVTAPGMNPPHGQPGHRCDIQVGAPLNSKPPHSLFSNPTDSRHHSTPQPVPTVTAPGMNPPHGQPGHRCDIAVGAP
ncbi:MAG: hypothetical protein IPI66_14355 [Chitinophagaceae bacterium]|nr:hypothetical protein [Chitinophagaceae bacterium]